MNVLEDLISRHCQIGLTPTAIPGLNVSRSFASTTISMDTPPPVFCVIATGRKWVCLGQEEFVYDPETYLVTSADLPVTGRVLESPTLAMALELDPGLLAEILVDLGPLAGTTSAEKAIAVSHLEGDLLDSVIRLLRLLDEPQHIAALAPLAKREIYYRLLLGPKGGMLRQLALPTSHGSSIRRAIGLIRRRFNEPVRIDELAQVAGMSQPTLHRHFRAATGMSPIQFQKRLRLQEARRRLLSANEGAAVVAMEVGYESPSQFNREYRRMFGAPPVREALMAREAVGV